MPTDVNVYDVILEDVHTNKEGSAATSTGISPAGRPDNASSDTITIREMLAGVKDADGEPCCQRAWHGAAKKMPHSPSITSARAAEVPLMHTGRSASWKSMRSSRTRQAEKHLSHARRSKGARRSWTRKRRRTNAKKPCKGTQKTTKKPPWRDEEPTKRRASNGSEPTRTSFARHPKPLTLFVRSLYQKIFGE